MPFTSSQSGQSAPGSPYRVTVVVPTYNRREKLRRCILGLLDIDLEGLALDLRIQDDGSSDGTDGMLRELTADYTGPVRIVYRRQENQGPAAARNAAIAESDTELVAFLDDDCIPVAAWLRELIAGFTAPDIAAVGGKCRPGDAPTHVARYFSYRGANEYPSARRPFEFPVGGNCMYRREVLERFGGFDALFREAAAEDMDLAWRVKKAGGYRFAYQPEAVVLDHNIETVSQLIGRAMDRGREKSLKRAVRGTGSPTWVRTLREGLVLPYFALRLLVFPFLALGFLARGVAPGDAVPFALIDCFYRLIMRWARFGMMLEIASGRRVVERETARTSTAGPATAPR